MEKTKKVWHKPELIVLVRSKPEESVLTVCKVSIGQIIDEYGPEAPLCSGYDWISGSPRWWACYELGAS